MQNDSYLLTRYVGKVLYLNCYFRLHAYKISMVKMKESESLVENYNSKQLWFKICLKSSTYL